MHVVYSQESNIDFKCKHDPFAELGKNGKSHSFGHNLQNTTGDMSLRYICSEFWKCVCVYVFVCVCCVELLFKGTVHMQY